MMQILILKNTNILPKNVLFTCTNCQNYLCVLIMYYYLLQTSFKQGREALVHCIVDFCESKSDANAVVTYQAVAKQGVWLRKIICILNLQAVLYKFNHVLIPVTHNEFP